MYKRILTFILILCMSMGNMPNVIVYATENQEFIETTCTVFTNSNVDEQDTIQESEVIIPQNGSEIYMEEPQLQMSTFNLRKSEDIGERYTVLILDNSPSISFVEGGVTIYTADTALPYVKEAAKKFVEDINEASGSNYTAIVSYSGSKATIISDFTNDTNELIKAINSIYVSGNVCSVHSALTTVEQMLDFIDNPEAIKNVVLFTSGVTSGGEYNYAGRYNSSTIGSTWENGLTGVKLYAYANSAYAAAETLKEKCTIYTIGLFNTMEDMPEQGRNIVQFFKLCACDWASSQEHFYDVKDPNDLEFVFAQVADNIVRRTGTFLYPGTGMDYTSTYYYDDNYFNSSSYDYNASLATMSLCLELSAWGSEDEEDYTNKMKNAEALLEELGFVGFDHNYTDFSEDGICGKPTKDSVGAIAANKKINFNDKEYTLIAVAVRGGGYEREWASNFKIGENGEHQGFSEARDIVIQFIEDYITEQGISGDIKIWITGFSRAAATANMVAGAIDDRSIDLADCNLELEDMFAYTFETPAGALEKDTDDSKYNNIHNIVNRNDPVPKVAPAYWNFDRYGVDHYLPTVEDDGVTEYANKLEIMLQRYEEMQGYTGYVVDDFEMKKVKIDFLSVSPGGNPFVSIEDDNENALSQSVFLDSYITILSKDFLKNRANYVECYQLAIRDACGIFFGTSEEKTEKLIEEVSDKFSSNWGLILTKFFFVGVVDAYKTVADYLKECLDTVGITNYTQDEFENSVTMLCHLLLTVVASHPNLASTLVDNLSGIGQAHYPELCLAWMQSMDSNYTTDASLNFSTGKYRIVRINCPIDVTVCDVYGNAMASIINDTPQPNGEVLVAYNEDGEKLLYLPVNQDYVVKLIATDTGVMNYAIQEYDSNVGESNHMVLFNDIQVTKGQEYTAYLPRYSDEEVSDSTGCVADTTYTMYLDTELLLPSEELKGEEVFNAYYNINANSYDATKGIVFGSGMRQYGTFAKVTAEAYAGYEFAGWYEEDELISEDSEYRFRVSEDVELHAKFKKMTEEETEEGIESGIDDIQGNKIEGIFKVMSHWDTGFSGEISLKNTTDNVVHNWVVQFDLPYEIVNIWDGVISTYDNGVYTVQNAKYNWDINPGESVTFGFNVKTEAKTIIEPTYYNLVEKPVNTVLDDYEIVYKVNSDWETAFSGQIEITNVSTDDIYDWTIEFDSTHTFNQFWNAEIISHEGNHYIIKNKGYNAIIGAGQTLILGFEASATNENSIVEPINYSLTTIDMN